MKKSISHLYLLLAFFMIAIIISSFPIRGIDITWSLASFKNIGDFLYSVNGNYISSLMTWLFTKSTYIRVILFGLVTVVLFDRMAKLVDKENLSLFPIGVFLFFTIDRSFLSNSFMSIYGFSNHILGSLFTIFTLYLIIKDRFYKIHPILLGIMGLVFTMLNPIYTCLIFILVLVDIYKKSKSGEITNNVYYLLFGTLIGVVYTSINTRFYYTGLSYNLIHGFMDTIKGSNFLVIIILSALIMASALKMFSKKRKVESILSIMGVSSFLFMSLLSDNNYLVYASYIMYFIASYYVLSNVTYNRAFKNRIKIYYFTKIIFTIILCLFGNVTLESTALLYLIDIVLILELYNVLLPQSFLHIVWGIALVIMLASNIYVFKNVEKKYNEVNFYIRNKLECTKDEFTIPNRYNNYYIKEYLPSNREELEEYIEYYKIDLYDKDIDIEFKFKE